MGEGVGGGGGVMGARMISNLLCVCWGGGGPTPPGAPTLNTDISVIVLLKTAVSNIN